MKKLLLIIICISVLALRTIAPVYAATQPSGDTYARASSRAAYFFAEKDLSSSLFAVPYTYCVKILRDDGDWYYVQYAEDEGIYRALYGYVLKNDFDELENPPEVTYLYKSLTITYSADDGDLSLPVLDEIELEAAFYGTYYSGATAYSYVLCRDSFGYIRGANDDYPLIDVPSDGDGGTQTDPRTDGGQIITAVIIVVLSAGALILVFISSKKRKSE